MVLKFRLACWLLSALPLFAFAQAPGTLDASFGTSGVSNASFLNSSSVSRCMARQPDGKLILGGQYTSGGVGFMAFARFNTNGVLDNTFGNGGKAAIQFDNANITVTAVHVLADGKIIAAGISNGKPALLRLTATGAPDNTFGTAGVVTFDNDLLGINDMAIVGGKIVGCGIADQGNGRVFCVFRRNADGTPDNSFGTSGFTYTNVGSQPTLTKMAVQTDGKILLTGTTYNSTTLFDLILFRYTANGVPDNTFGTNGRVSSVFGANSAYEQGAAIAVQPDGKIVVAGRLANAGPTVFLVARYNAGGTVDNTFGTNGSTTIKFGDNDEAKAVIVQPDGRIVVVGFSLSGTANRIALARLTATGAPDNTFGTSGKTTTLVGTRAWGEASLLQADGKIVVGGYADINNLRQFVAARYHSGLMVSTQNPDPSVQEPMMFPNPSPAGETAFFRCTLTRPAEILFRLFAADGRLVYAWPSQSLLPGEQVVPLMLPQGLPSSVYHLQWATDLGVGSALWTIE